MNGFEMPVAVVALASYTRLAFATCFGFVTLLVAGFCIDRFVKGRSSRDHVSFSSCQNVHDLIEQWATRRRYLLVHSEHQRRVYQKGDGAWVNASVLEVDFLEGRYSISSYSKFGFLGVQRYLAFSNRSIVSKVPRMLEKRRVDELVASLGPVDSVAELDCDFDARECATAASGTSFKAMRLVPSDPSSRIGLAWKAAIVSGCITAGVGVVSMFTGESWMPNAAKPFSLDSSLIIDAVVIFALAFGVYKRSRVCAILLFAFFVLSKLIMMAYSQQFGQLPFAIAFGFCYWQGVSGTFAHHRDKVRSSAAAR